MGNTPVATELIVKCPFCKQGDISYTHFSGYYAMTTSRISAGSKQIPRLRGERIIVHNSCPVCKKSKQELKELIKGGADQVPHEERIKRLQNSGLPTHIENFHVGSDDK
jgi:hypothetical protein